MNNFVKGVLCLALWGLWTSLLMAQTTLPKFASLQDDPEVLQIQIPSALDSEKPQKTNYDFLVLTLDPSWAPDWQQAAFKLKSKIIELKTGGEDVLVGIQATLDQLNGLMAHDTAAYFDGYIFTEDPVIPNEDSTGKLWQIVKSSEKEVLTTLVEASSLGIELVLFDQLNLDKRHRDFLQAIQNTATGSLDLQPKIRNLEQTHAQFFLQPETGHYHLGVYAPDESEHFVYFSLTEGLSVNAIYPENIEFTHRQFGKRTELGLPGASPYYFFELVPSNPDSNTESLAIVEKGAIDPYELVVKNQVFKDREQQKFQSLEVDELLTYRYQTPDGTTLEISWEDTVIARKDKAMERIRRNLYLGGARWRREELPKLPLLEAERVKTKPLIVDLNKTYLYEYLGEDTVDGHATWRVGFKPKVPGNFSKGTVWIDQKTGAHRKLRAIQSDLEPPVQAVEMTAFFDWVEDNGTRYWTQIRESGLQVLNVVGERISLQVDTVRSEFKFNRESTDQNLSDAYASNVQILRDTPKGYRYLEKKKGQRILKDTTFFNQRALLGGIFWDPSFDFPLPLGGFNYTTLDFLGKGYQANFFIAGAINDIIISNPDFLGTGWDLSAELFLTPLHFGESIYQGDEEIEEEEVERLRNSLNVTLGIPVTNFFKISANYSLAHVDFKRADDTSEEFVLPETHLEHIYRLQFNYDRKRFASELDYESVSRSDWEAWGLPDNTEQIQDSYRVLRFDTSLTKPLGTFQTLRGSVGYSEGWDMDRFARAGLLNGAVSGFDDESVQATKAFRAEIAYDRGISDLFQFTFRVNGARTWLETTDIFGQEIRQDPLDFIGVATSANFFGPWGTTMRFNIGYGLSSDIDGLEGDIQAQLVFFKLF